MLSGFGGLGLWLHPLGVADLARVATEAPAPDFSLWSQLIKVLAILSAMVGTLVLALALWKRLAPRSKQGPALIQVLATHYLAPKQALILVAVGRERFLVATSPDHLNLVPLAGEHQSPEVPAAEEQRGTHLRGGG